MDADDRAPPIVERPRTADEIAAVVDARHMASGFAPRGVDRLRDALVRIGARYGEILTEQLNALPERHIEAFLSRFAGPPAPPEPAEVLLSFVPVSAPLAEPRSGPPPVGVKELGSGPSLLECSPGAVAQPIVVPAHTEVAAAPAAGDSEPVVFETVADLAVLRAEAVQALVFDARRFVFARIDGLLSPAGYGGASLLADARPFEFAAHFDAAGVLGVPGLAQVGVDVELAGAGLRPPEATFEWGLRTNEGFVALAVESDSTSQLSRSGTVMLAAPKDWSRSAIAGIESRWLSCRMVHHGVALPDGVTFVPPCVTRIRVFAIVEVRGAALAAVCHGEAPLDPSKDYFVFGERPRFGDVFQMSAPAFMQPDTQVTLHVEMTNPAGLLEGPLPPVRAEGRPRVRWEAHSARGWVPVDADDGTESFTRGGELTFTLPDDVAATTIAGRSGGWVRARLVAGHYGPAQVIDGVVYPVAPSVAKLSIDARARVRPRAPHRVVLEGLLGPQLFDPAPADAFDLFAVPREPGTALYLALRVHEARSRDLPLSLQVQPAEPTGRPVMRSLRAPGAGSRWQWLDAGGWRDCEVEADETSGMRRAGLVRLRIRVGEAGASLPLWLRALWPPTHEAPALRRIAINAVRARQTTTVRNEIVGSSTGRPRQVFDALRTPIVGEVVLQVFEGETWVRWEHVGDLAEADAQARVFTLDRVSGRIEFGDAMRGRIPPPGANNLRLHRYHVGGGRRGNRPARAVSQLRTTVPYIEAVANFEPSAGGQDAPDAATRQREAGAWLRHRGRAVCRDDYTDLARAAAPEVARAYCLGACDPAAGRWSAAQAAGTVSVIVVPDSDAPRPQPTLELLETVKRHLDSRCPLAVEVVVLGPAYAAVSVSARVQCAPGESAYAVAGACRQRLQQFLHPLHGGASGGGWAPGVRPHRSDLVALLGAVDGVQHVDALQLRVDEPAGAEAPGIDDAMVCCGSLEIGS
ncbi:MAG TPA: putative baseplate assembly protein [Rubrivivax sp.]|nr:putative baseplate assembly protein [Rubrivivax sp.]HRY86454.1 putative baseplate assembly protein [Rubrivivax sp.]